jgi:inorganic pyrophosphatase
MKKLSLVELSSFNSKTEDINMIVETPRGNRNKFDFDVKSTSSSSSLRFFPREWSFPFEFGFIPSTRGEDGDPLDILLLMDAPTTTGCLVTGRLVA